ncbi:universal stress protein [Bradyrhizobium sp. Tv2a-2]|uniref:universal stress protein n=1 Tax=Bradyrhizobium sp. Tv2a-2 TaxID=113395 RepID=UPI0003FD2FE2|nr:universal stress protein [Bradyrhizobium sp. Tv2a-2]
MAIKDIQLPLVGEPSEAARAAIQKCMAICGDFGARVTAVAVEEDISVRPKVLISPDLDNAAAIAAVRSVTDAQGFLKIFHDVAASLGVRSVAELHRLASADVADTIARAARLHDLSLVPVKSHHSFSERLVERLLFESGRPMILCPEELAADLPLVLNDVLIAWDGSAPAARAVGDALPILKAAETVHIVTATDDATAEEVRSGRALSEHLAEHGVSATFTTIGISGSSIGKVLAAHVSAHQVHLLVMGAYHHSRLNETVWGGVTKTIIGQPPCWVMMSR